MGKSWVTKRLVSILHVVGNRDNNINYVVIGNQLLVSKYLLCLLPGMEYLPPMDCLQCERLKDYILQRFLNMYWCLHTHTHTRAHMRVTTPLPSP